jgi:hypothetical protein
MSQLSRMLCVWALLVPLMACGATQRPAKPVTGETAPDPATPVQKATAAPSNPDSAILGDFNARLDNFVKKQRAIAKQSLELKETKDPAEIKRAQDMLAAKIVQARPNAKQGDIFTPQIAALFKRLLNPELKGAEGRETKQALQEEDGEVAQINLKVNAKWPDSEPLTTMPPNMLAVLPQLPMDVEYRISNKRHLVLRDVDANIIVDYIYNAIR